MLAQLKPQIDTLVRMAEQGSDASGAADLLFDQVFLELPEEIFERLANFVESDSFVSSVIILNPSAKPHAAWFETFKKQIVKRLFDEDQAAGQQPSNSGPVANPN